MFGFGKRATPPEPQSDAKAGEPVIAALLLDEKGFSIADFQNQLVGNAAKGLAATSIETKNGFLLFQLGDEIAAVAPMPVPYPPRDLEGPCATSWMWPKEKPASSVKQHRTHVLITLVGGKSERIARRSVLTRLTAMAAAQPGVMGIYWPEATLVHYPPVFIKMAQAILPKGPPLFLWVDFRGVKNPDGTYGMFTTGLRALGKMEIEIPKIVMKPNELREWTMNIANYILKDGVVIKDGNTIGMSAEHQIKVLHRPSSFGGKGLVLRLQC